MSTQWRAGGMRGLARSLQNDLLSTDLPLEGDGLKNYGIDNFVRSLPQAQGNNPPLEWCPPRSRDRYVGLAGRIARELTAVSPLFTGDAGGMLKGERDHYRVAFFRCGSPGTPATSMQGAPRRLSTERSICRARSPAACSSCGMAPHPSRSSHQGIFREWRSPTAALGAPAGVCPRTQSGRGPVGTAHRGRAAPCVLLRHPASAA